MPSSVIRGTQSGGSALSASGGGGDRPCTGRTIADYERVHNPPPPRCPFRTGDRVRYHGYSGEAEELNRVGWTGTVAGCVGDTILSIDLDLPYTIYVGTIDGSPPSVRPVYILCRWGDLEPEDAPLDMSARCTCCRERRRAARPRHLQLELLGAAP